MKKFALKRPSPANPKIWEWKTHQPIENSPYVDLVYFDTQAAAAEAGKSWDSKAQVQEVNLPD
jgi:hypothetical protein